MQGILLINLGTPEAPTTKAVRRYLREFLSDPYVIDIHPVARWFLVNGVIVPFRSPKSAAAYQKIWMDAGSPLLVNSQNLVLKLQRALGDQYCVILGMRYGNPSIKSAIKDLISAGVKSIKVIPLYPQYAESSTESSVALVKKIAGELSVTDKLSFVGPFYNHDGFINAFALQGTPLIESFKPDHVLFSYHGLPVRHVQKLDLSKKHCQIKVDCCDVISDVNQNCYRAQCLQTTRLLGKKLSLAPEKYSTSFQSRLGRTPWIKPFTDEILISLAEVGIKKLLVFCPSFVADCLETLEEIAMRARESFKQHGGEELVLVPSLNDSVAWVQTLADSAN